MEPFVVFVAYASHDGFDFAGELVDWLDRRKPPVTPWIDRDNAQNKAWDTRIENAILGADLVLLVLTDAAAAEDSYARDELRLARKWGKPIWAVRPPGGRSDPPITVNGGPIDVGLKRGGWDRLDHDLRLLRPINRTVEKLTTLFARLEERATRATGSQRKTLAAQAGRLHAVIQQEIRRAENPAAAAAVVSCSIDEGLNEDAATPSRTMADSSFQVIGGPPAITGTGMHDRVGERELLLDLLADPQKRLVTLCGPAGSGKTALLNDLLPQLKASGYARVAYVSTHGPRRVTPHLLLDRLARMLPEDEARDRMLERLGDESYGWQQNLESVLAALGDLSALLIIDNAEELIADERLIDVHLREFTHTLSNRRGHRTRLLLATRDRLTNGPNDPPRVDIPPSLPFPFAADFLRELDDDGVVGLADADEATLQRAYRLTQGHPRALELLYAVLRDEPTPDLDELLTSTAKASSDGDGIPYLIRRATLALQGPMQRVLQALALYHRGVRPSAVNWLLAPHDTGLDSTAVLELLCDRRLVRRDGDLYYLPRGDEASTLLETIPPGMPADRDSDPPRYTRHALWHRAADYFKTVRNREVRIHDLNDLAAHFAEIELRLAGGEYLEAAKLINEVDIEHLHLWGYRSLIIRLREHLIGRLGDGIDDIENRYELATAYLEASEPDKAITLLEKACEATLAPVLKNAFRMQLAQARLMKGELKVAADLYTDLLKKGNAPTIEICRIGLATCLEELGMVDKAMDQYAAALEVIEDADPEVASAVFLNQGLLHQKLGRPLAALQAIQRAHHLAKEHQLGVLAAKCVDAMAQVHIDMGQLNKARRLADEAIRAATDAGNADLCRETYSTRALALLLGGDLTKAHDTADAATRFFENQRPFAALALLGITQVRLHDVRSAETSFSRAHRDIGPLLTLKPPAAQLLDINGLVLAGLARADSNDLRPAIAAYRQARQRVRAPGVVLRAVRLLDELFDDDDSPQVRQTLDAAAGLDEP
jgi:tetratricopeptide (TPR) repeat protein